MEVRRPLIVEVKRGSLEDGPGIRTVVFFKGCPLRCVFCQNPEAQGPGPEIAFVAQRCIRCGSCSAQCQQNAIDLLASSRIDRRRCDLCGRCAAECPSGALRLIGKYWPVETLAELLLRDIEFYRPSDGGVTLSGGECTLFPDYVHELLTRLKAERVHVTLETCGSFDYQVFSEKVLPNVDLVLFDFKLIDMQASLRYLGRSNELILSNLKKLLAESSVQVRPRIPLIPGITDTHDNLAGIVDQLCHLGAREVSLLAYNPLGLSMYTPLGRPTPDLPSGFMKSEREREIVEMFREAIRCRAAKLPATHAVGDRDGARVELAHPATAQGQLHGGRL